jgi:hypothetical protein
MAGRCISVTRKALGTTRVMRTCGMMGEVVGKAAWIATTQNTSPRGVYENYLPQLINLLEQPGAARRDSLDGDLYVPENAYQLPPRFAGLDAGKLGGIVIDDTKAKLQGKWTSGNGLKPAVNGGYSYASPGENTSATFPIRIRKSGSYQVRYYWRPHENRCQEATLAIAHGKGTTKVTVDLTKTPAGQNFQDLGTFEFVDVLPASVTLTGPAGSGYLHADCVQLLPVK